MKPLITLLLLFAFGKSDAQISYRQKVYAYVQKADGEEPKHFMYIEMQHDSIPIWDSAVIGGKGYVVHFTPIETTPVQVGERKGDGRMINIKPAAEGKLWSVEFDATGENKTAPNTAAILLTGRISGRKISYKILTEVEIR